MATTETLAPIDEWVASFHADLDRFRRWFADPRLTGLRGRIAGTQVATNVQCVDTQDYEHVLLLLRTTGIDVSDEFWTVKTRFRDATFGEHVRLTIVCPRGDA